MSAGVFAAVLAAALMHAGWNATLKVKLEPLTAVTLIAMACGVAGLPFLLWFGFPRAEAWPYLVASLILHLGYYLTLSEAYRRADMGQVYPIARGGAPLLTALVSLLVLREPVAPLAALGVGILGGGVMLMSLGGGRGRAPDLRAVGFALATAATVSGYTIADGTGARTAADPHAYASALFVLDAFPIGLLLFRLRGPEAFRQMRPYWALGLGGGAMSFAAYWIAIWAMTVAPIALVAALRESSVLFATLIAVLVLREPLVPARIVAALVIVAGIAAMRLA